MLNSEVIEMQSIGNQFNPQKTGATVTSVRQNAVWSGLRWTSPDFH